MKNRIETVIFWGALWGLEEATLGHFLHLLPVSLGWIFWFPLAFAFMYAVYEKTGKVKLVLITSVLAAAIKLVDLFLPIRIDKVLNPCAAILLEGLAVFAVLWVMDKRPALQKHKGAAAFSASFLQEALYMVYISVIPGFVPVIPAPAGMTSYLFYGIHGMINGLTLFLFLTFIKIPQIPLRARIAFPSLTSRRLPPYIKTAAPYLLLAAAVMAQWVV